MTLSLCDSCALVEFVSCDTTITLPITFTPVGTAFLWINDQHNHNYTATIVDTAGVLTVDLSGIDRTFTSASGDFEMSISTSETENTYDEFTVGYTQFTCMIADFIDLN